MDEATKHYDDHAPLTDSDLFREEETRHIDYNDSMELRQRRNVRTTQLGDSPPRRVEEKPKLVMEWAKAIVFSLAVVTAFTTYAWMKRTRHFQRKEANYGVIDKCDLTTYPVWRIDELKELSLSGCKHTTLPDSPELWSRFKSLKKLDLGDNSLSDLPDAIGVLSPSLEILFLSENKFASVPEIIKRLSRLRVLSLRGNHLTDLTTSNMPTKSLVWLILTNNQITKIDPNIQELKLLRKLMLSHNDVAEIPLELGQCKNLELIRLANNNLSNFPIEVLGSLPSLAWISLSGNPMAKSPKSGEKVINEDQVELFTSSILGRGASGIVYRGKFEGKEVAVKMFKSQSKGSDGNPEDEAAINGLIQHPFVMSALGIIESNEGSSTAYKGMVMNLLSGTYSIGTVPNFNTVTRDEGLSKHAKNMNSDKALSVIWNVASALDYIHSSLGVTHGDVYLHNILMDGSGNALLSDWGASWVYGRDGSDFSALIEKIEVLAFGRLVEDLVSWVDLSEQFSRNAQDLLQSITRADLVSRPTFKEIKNKLLQIPEFEIFADSEGSTV
mmetsp:Transcript_3102/g.6733  ORF Transcript_3102/g.6733 Transcript_3102/m.6733 type:complete len:556 (-) Transcript_3102:52-1719(-)